MDQYVHVRRASVCNDSNKVLTVTAYPIYSIWAKKYCKFHYALGWSERYIHLKALAASSKGWWILVHCHIYKLLVIMLRTIDTHDLVLLKQNVAMWHEHMQQSSQSSSWHLHERSMYGSMSIKLLCWGPQVQIGHFFVLFCLKGLKQGETGTYLLREMPGTRQRKLRIIKAIKFIKSWNDCGLEQHLTPWRHSKVNFNFWCKLSNLVHNVVVHRQW